MKCLGDIGLQPVPRRREARKSDRSDLRAALRNDVPNSIGLELLREGPLLLNVLPLPSRKTGDEEPVHLVDLRKLGGIGLAYRPRADRMLCGLISEAAPWAMERSITA